MWRSLGSYNDIRLVQKLWRDAVEFVYIEVIANALVRDNGPDYWYRARELVATTLCESDHKEITLGRFLPPYHSRLFARWVALNIDLPI
jgi:hypothetical protein